MVLIGDSILGKMCRYIPKCHGVHSDHFPQEHGDAVNEGVESPVFGKMRENYAPDWPTGQHRPPRWAQRCLKTKVVIIYRLETKVVIIYQPETKIVIIHRQEKKVVIIYRPETKVVIIYRPNTKVVM